MEVISDIRHACARTEPPNVALILSNIRIGTATADALVASGEGYLGQDPEGAPEGFNTIRGAGAQLGRDKMKHYLGSPPGRAAVWHQDEQYRARPAHLTLLYCVHAPPDALGDTRFCDTCLGYEALPTALAATITGLQVSHSLANIPMMNVNHARAPITTHLIDVTCSVVEYPVPANTIDQCTAPHAQRSDRCCCGGRLAVSC